MVSIFTYSQLLLLLFNLIYKMWMIYEIAKRKAISLAMFGVFNMNIRVKNELCFL